MKITETFLKDCFIIEPKVFKDSRGEFFEAFNQKLFQEKTGLNVKFVQDNQSISLKGVVRGLHIQKGEYAQAKLVRVIQGRVLDVVVDVREKSDTFGKVFSIELSKENQLQLFIPKGFLHGFSVLEDNTIVTYKCDNYYNKESEDGVIYNDPILNIDWKLKTNEIILSEKDAELKLFKEI
ncbi:dTDP-4-dehydrorhamnose 3,5-epimerase [Polaribacter dokdonensis]|uniref:dTDP-4-dehydrorhamnose 3,5-epimerase n=1 Tax=Polaribacter dokdonensis DSW-5 TaxID=1300348 RepID=A0A0M9CEZ2_9FLAO|nr:dTDP-4-dehydrorhamnose 3,5-epimerase [Polaribacter dokdonensis]KOY51281.1 dTDP-4-dehydrorhamnose 3,5-epimerase [Polaribacter dokdonensis DSW-5]SEE14759.1 dTDP-4-dehydrorhamnose 3,5-epimerase [Polaribacter dokdonensis DSW-5]